VNNPIVVQQEDPIQRKLLLEILGSASDRQIFDLRDFEELVDIISRQNFSLVFMELKIGNKEQIQWLEKQDDYLIGIINRKWEQEQLTPFMEAGLSDYIFKPYQPPRLKQLISKLLTHFHK